MLREADPLFVTQIMRDPRVWEWVREDGKSVDQFSHNPADTYFQFEDLGFVMYRRVVGAMYEVHIAMRRGSRALAAFVLEALAEMRLRGAQRFIAPIGDWNRAAVQLARKCGFVEIARKENCRRDGGLYQTVYMESA
jgi:hypothetical protein